MKGRICFTVLMGLIVSSQLFGGDKHAKTEDGKDVILRDDGTWHFVGDGKKDKKASTVYKGKHGTFTITLSPGVWIKKEKPSNPDMEAMFTHKDGDVIAWVTVERLRIPIDTLKKAVLDNVREHDKEASIVESKKRTVNGIEVLFLTINARVDGIPFTYLYCLYSGKAGAIQLVTVTGQHLFKEYRSEMEAFLNGFAIVKK